MDVDITVEEISGKYRSKLDLYTFLTSNLAYYLPEYRFATHRFMLQIIQGKKNVFTRSDIANINIRKYKETRAKNILKSVLPHE